MGTHEEKGKVKVCERGPSEDELDGVVDKLELEDDLAGRVLARGPDAGHVEGRVEGGEEGAVEPTAALGNELGDRGGHGRREMKDVRLQD